MRKNALKKFLKVQNLQKYKNNETAIMLWKILLNLVDNCFHDR